MIRVVNASPLIHLARVSLLESLREPGGVVEAVVVPDVVFEEVMRGIGHDPAVGLVEQATREWLTIVPTHPPHPDINPTRIDAGEIAVLSHALETARAVVVLDDRAARAEAARLAIPMTGTLRLLLDAKELGIIASVRVPLEELRAGGMRLSDAVWNEVLALAGE
jgi:predicted nucleic acid-binding protein